MEFYYAFLLTSGQYLHQHEKVDDEDGHYIVAPDTELAERCKSERCISSRSA
jgi:hypothetical protein